MTKSEKAYAKYSAAYDAAWDAKDGKAAFKAEDEYKKDMSALDDEIAGLEKRHD
jgi:hypothetical protein